MWIMLRELKPNTTTGRVVTVPFCVPFKVIDLKNDLTVMQIMMMSPPPPCHFFWEGWGWALEGVLLLEPLVFLTEILVVLLFECFAFLVGY